MNLVDPEGEIWDVFWDIANVTYDISAAVSKEIKGDHQASRSHLEDAAFDVVSAMIHFVPAGVTKGIKVEESITRATNSVVDPKKRGRERESIHLMTQGLD